MFLHPEDGAGQAGQDAGEEQSSGGAMFGIGAGAGGLVHGTQLQAAAGQGGIDRGMQWQGGAAGARRGLLQPGDAIPQGLQDGGWGWGGDRQVHSCSPGFWREEQEHI